MAMLKAAGIVGASWVLPVLLLFFVTKKLRRNEIFLGVALNVAYQSLVAAFLHGRVIYGALYLTLVVVLAAILTHLTLKEVPHAGSRPAKFFWRGLAILSAITFFDQLLVLGHQGWAPLFGSGPYFRAPFNNDGERNVILVEALLRGSENPFLAGTSLVYQLLWHHGVAPFVALFEGPERANAVAGATLATGVFGFALLIWALREMSPRFFSRVSGWLLLGALFLCADLYHFGEALLLQGRIGIEADWSWPPYFIHYFPLKLSALLSPQHFLFFVWLSLYLALKTKLRYFFFGLCWIASLPLALFFFPFYWLARPHEWKQHAGALLSAIGLHWVVLGFAPWALFFRKGLQSPRWFDAPPAAWPFFPFVGIAATGLLGLAAVATGILLWKRKGTALLKNWEMGFFLVALPLSHYVYTMTELRRHFSMLAFFVAMLWLARFFPSLSHATKRRLASTVAVIALALHGYFVYCFVEKPNQLDAKIPWQDYLAMREIVRERFSTLPVLAAVHPSALGTVCPPVMEATTSFAGPLSASVHTLIPPDKISPLGKIIVAGDAAPYAERLGYRAILWGPAEEKVWGEKTRRRFIDGRAELARAGSVGLYLLKDKWENEVEKEKRKGGDFAYLLGHRFAVEGWRGEAVEYYQLAIQAEPLHRPAWLELARVVESMGQTQWRHEILQSAIRTVPNFNEAQAMLHSTGEH